MNLYNVLGNQIPPVYQATALVLMILLAGGLVVRSRLASRLRTTRPPANRIIKTKAVAW